MNIWVHLGVAIDENRFHNNCVGKSEKSLSQKESLQIMKSGLNNIVDKTYLYFKDFIHSWLDTISLRMVMSEKRWLYSLANMAKCNLGKVKLQANAVSGLLLKHT